MNAAPHPHPFQLFRRSEINIQTTPVEFILMVNHRIGNLFRPTIEMIHPGVPGWLVAGKRARRKMHGGGRGTCRLDSSPVLVLEFLICSYRGPCWDFGGVF